MVVHTFSTQAWILQKGACDLSHSQLPVLLLLTVQFLHPQLQRIKLTCILTVWCLCVESSVVLLEKGICYDL